MRVDPNKWLNLVIVAGLLVLALVLVLRNTASDLPEVIAAGLLGYLARELPAGAARARVRRGTDGDPAP